MCSVHKSGQDKPLQVEFFKQHLQNLPKGRSTVDIFVYIKNLLHHFMKQNLLIFAQVKRTVDSFSV